jgi:hypothetical protein
VAQDGKIEAGFIAEMVVDGRDIGSGAIADVTDGSGLEAVFGKYFAGGIDEARPRGVVIGEGYGLKGSYHLNTRLKQTF